MSNPHLSAPLTWEQTQTVNSPILLQYVSTAFCSRFPFWPVKGRARFKQDYSSISHTFASVIRQPLISCNLITFLSGPHCAPLTPRCCFFSFCSGQTSRVLPTWPRETTTAPPRRGSSRTSFTNRLSITLTRARWVKPILAHAGA